MEKIFHQMSAEEVLKELNTDSKGLSENEVKKRREEHGSNTLPKPKVKSLALIVWHQVVNPLIYILIAAGIICLITGNMKDAIFIFVIILLNTGLGTYQEWRAENSAAALQNMVKINCRVERDGKTKEIDAEELVPGDIVLLESGQKVPADLRVIESNDCSVEEALLTGESAAVTKTSEPIEGGSDLSLGDRLNMLFAATTVQKGRATGVVTATGLHTEMGKIADSLSSTLSEKPPLVRRMEKFSKKISIIILLICVLLGLTAYFQGMGATEVFFLMVAIGVSAIPEGLPIGLTVALSIGTRRMAKRNVIVRKLPAVEGLGSCTLIASDKTGTLTMDQQSIKKLFLPNKKTYEITGQGYNGEGDITENDQKIEEPDEELDRLILASIMANESELQNKDNDWEHSGDAVDVAFKALAYKAGKTPEDYQQRAELKELIPYESENKFSGAFYETDGKLFFAMKGALEVIRKRLPEKEREEISAISEEMAAEGYRVMAIAGADSKDTNMDDLPELQLLGLIGMIDPLRPEARDAIKECHDAGIEVVMITGDHPATAFSIAKDLGITSDKDDIITGADLSRLEEKDKKGVEEAIKSKKVFARVAPLQKQIIVEAKKSAGHFVAVTGDGANDAPALKSAHIGVAMGSGTDLAKEASSIIITDNNFASITAAVEEGRFTFENLRKIIYLLISTGIAEILALAVAIVLDMPLPFIAVQILWLNLVTNGIQDIALAFEKGDKSVMKRPPRKPDESIFNRLMNGQIIVSGLFIAIVIFAAWYYMIEYLEYEEVHARTVVMMLMVLIQNFHVLNCRSETRSIFRIPFKNNYLLLAGVVFAQVLHICASYIPGLNSALQLDHIRFTEWIVLLPAAISILLVMEIFKWIWRKRETAKKS